MMRMREREERTIKRTENDRHEDSSHEEFESKGRRSSVPCPFDVTTRYDSPFSFTALACVDLDGHGR
jgi:hypothetical protein